MTRSSNDGSSICSEREKLDMYVGGGTVVLILIIVLIVFMVRR